MITTLTAFKVSAWRHQTMFCREQFVLPLMTDTWPEQTQFFLNWLLGNEHCGRCLSLKSPLAQVGRHDRLSPAACISVPVTLGLQLPATSNSQISNLTPGHCQKHLRAGAASLPSQCFHPAAAPGAFLLSHRPLSLQPGTAQQAADLTL